MDEKYLISPVVSVLGHVDHGKTSLLDAIRKTNIAGGEFGGITQAIGASSIEMDEAGIKRKITFIDTPGHEAFSKMRGRGSVVADVGLLIISSVDGIMPQTKESIKLLLNAKVPFIVVFTKSDLPNSIVPQIKQQLLKEDLILDEFGGSASSISVSSKTGENIDKLLNLILLVFDMNYPNAKNLLDEDLKGIIIESKLDVKSGPKATAVIKSGKLAKTDVVWAGNIKAKIKALINANGEQINSVLAGEAVEILGFEQVPEIGATLAKNKAESLSVFENKDLTNLKKEDENKSLSVILCADTKGSLEAILNSLPKEVNVISVKTGDISEADIFFAKSTKSIILGFNLKIKSYIAKLAKVEKVLIKNYPIIYKMLDEIKAVLEGKRIASEEQILGVSKIQAEFLFDKKKVCGVLVEDGRIAKGDKIRLMRGENVIGESNVVSVRTGKEQITKVEKNKEAGVILSPQLDFLPGDVILSYS